MKNKLVLSMIQCGWHLMRLDFESVQQSVRAWSGANRFIHFEQASLWNSTTSFILFSTILHVPVPPYVLSWWLKYIARLQGNKFLQLFKARRIFSLGGNLEVHRSVFGRVWGYGVFSLMVPKEADRPDYYWNWNFI